MFFCLTHKQMLYNLIQLRDFTWHSTWALKRNAFLTVPAKRHLQGQQATLWSLVSRLARSLNGKLFMLEFIIPDQYITTAFQDWHSKHLLIISFSTTAKEWNKNPMQDKSLKLLHTGYIKTQTEGKETVRKWSKTPGGRPGCVMIPWGRYICTLNAECWTYIIHNLNSVPHEVRGWILIKANDIQIRKIFHVL